MPEFKVHNLWPIPVYQNNILVKEKWKVLVKSLDYERTHNDNSDISSDRYVLNSIPDLKLEIEDHCERYVRKYLKINNTAKFYLQNSWSNIHGPNEQSQIHHHGNSLLSGVFYPIFPKNSGNISFHKSSLYTNVFHSSFLLDFDEDTHINCSQYQLELSEGIIVIFPSHLEHSVEQNMSEQQRYSIAFNFYVRGEFGKEEYKLEIK